MTKTKSCNVNGKSGYVYLRFKRSGFAIILLTIQVILVIRKNLFSKTPKLRLVKDVVY